MTDTAPAAHSGTWPRPPRDLAARLFRALYPGFDLRTFGDLHVAVPKGTPWHAGLSLSELALQISAVQVPGPDPARCDQPGRQREDLIP
jgi:hypothetical protein